MTQHENNKANNPENNEMATLNPEKLPEVCGVRVSMDDAGNTSVVVTVDVDGETVHGTDDAPGEEDYCECCYGCWH